MPLGWTGISRISSRIFAGTGGVLSSSEKTRGSLLGFIWDSGGENLDHLRVKERETAVVRPRGISKNNPSAGGIAFVRAVKSTVVNRNVTFSSYFCKITANLKLLKSGMSVFFEKKMSFIFTSGEMSDLVTIHSESPSLSDAKSAIPQQKHTNVV